MSQHLTKQIRSPFVTENDGASNRYIYVKHNFNPNQITKVLINPHFKKTVYVNPKFDEFQFRSHSIPKIHVNPQVLKNFVTSAPQNQKTQNNVVDKIPDKKMATVISTKNKLIRIPIANRKRQNILHTKYKIVRSVVTGDCLMNGFRHEDKSLHCVPDSKIRSTSKPHIKSPKKKFVYINRFLSIDILAKNVLLKRNANVSKPGYVKINGILYWKSPNSLKKASETSISKISTCRVMKTTHVLNQKQSSLLTYRYRSSNKHQLLRFKKSRRSKLSKCNMPCIVYRKSGKCPGMINGSCNKLHNPEQIVVCPRFLQGACVNDRCLLSHKVSLEKMPTCKYYLHGLCSKDSCPYLHVKISPKADVCRDFLEGYCSKGAQCDKRHQFLCPEFEKTKKCVKRSCPYPHRNLMRENKNNNSAVKKHLNQTKNSSLSTTTDNRRYYKDSKMKNSLLNMKLDQELVENGVLKKRPKLGALPAFIPLLDG